MKRTNSKLTGTTGWTRSNSIVDADEACWYFRDGDADGVNPTPVRKKGSMGSMMGY